jgi:hypothetical protein
VLCNEIVIRCRNYVGCSELAFATETKSSAANEHSLLNCVLWSEIVIRWRNCVGCSELAFAAELCVVQRNCDSLLKLCRLQWISIQCRNWVVCSEFMIHCRNWVFYSELAFAGESCVMHRICDSLPKLCRLQRISIRCWIVCSAANFGFAAETVSSVVN